jgi:D-alanyl-D-alanine carboxypeptidase
MKRTFLAIFVFNLFVQTTIGQTALFKQITDSLDVQNFVQCTYSVSESEHAIGYGFGTNDPKNQGLNGNSLMVIGSLSKQFTAVMVLQAFDKGLIKLHCPISKYLPELTQSWADTVTVHHLLTHTHGIKSLTEPLKFKPGSTFDYSQLGFGLLSQILESVYHQDFVTFSHHFFEENGMHNTRHPLDSISKENVEKGYEWNEETDITDLTEVPFEVSTQNYVAAGCFISTINDLFIWNQRLHGGALLKKSTYRMMFRPKKNAIRDHPIFGRIHYCYGTTNIKINGTKYIGQTGYAPGFASMNFYCPKKKIGFTILSNRVCPTNLNATFTEHLRFLKTITDLID